MAYVLTPTSRSAQNLDEFVSICAEEEAIAAEHLCQGYFEEWLKDPLQRPDLVSIMHAIRRAIQQGKEERTAGLHTFLWAARLGKQPAAIHGRALDQGGQGIEGLEIRAEIVDTTLAATNGRRRVFLREVYTDCAGEFVLSVPLGSHVCLQFPRDKELSDGRTIVLRRGEVVELEACSAHIELKRVYDTAGYPIGGLVEREFVHDGTCRHEPFAGVPIDVLDEKRDILTSTQTGPLGEFSILTNASGPLTLRFAREYPVGGEIWTLAEPEIDIYLSPGHPLRLCEPVRYELAGAEVIGQVLGKMDEKETKGLPGVPVTLIHQGTTKAVTTRTGEAGDFRLAPVAPGFYKAVFPDPYVDRSSGNVWELPVGQRDRALVFVQSGEVNAVPAVLYMPERHVIEWRVTADDGGPAVERLVELRDAEGRRPIAQRRTDANGLVLFDLPEGGDFQIWVYADDRAPLEPLKKPVSVHSRFQGSSTIPSVPPDAGGGSPQRGGDPELTEAVVDATAYPILTESISYPGVPTPAPGAPGAAPLGPIVEGALREVLGWRPKTGDAKGFIAALTQSFRCSDVEGHTACRWTPRSYAAQIQADMGAITGAQASIFARATVALDQSLPLLDGLYALTINVLPEDQEAIRAIIRSELNELVSELGIEGGPRVQRVDELFELLLGLSPRILAQSPHGLAQLATLTDPERVKGQLAVLKERFGLFRRNADTIEQEQNLTNFLILVDYLNGLFTSWIAQRGFFDRSDRVEPFFGT